MTRRLLAGYLVITVLVLVLLEVPLAVFYAQRERERVTADLEHDAFAIASIYEDALETGVPLDPAPAEQYAADTGTRVVVVDSDGISQVDTDRDVGRDFSTRPEFAEALSGTTTSGTRSSETLATDIVYVAVPVASGGVVHGATRVTLDTSDVTARIHRFWWSLAAIAAVVLIAVGVVGWAVARSVSRPIRQLRDRANRYAQGDLAPSAEAATGPPEVRALAESMTTMARRLDDLLREHRAFVADASHQLRTPLTALRLRLENLQSEASGEQVESIDAAIDETDRLTALVGDLLQLARADEHPPPVPVDLGLRVSERVDTWSAVADSVGVGMRAELPDGPLVVTAVPGAIEQILDNLLDNALKVAPAGSAVVVGVEPGSDRHVLTVVDAGPGMTDAEKALAITRFWRGSTTSQGSGLGLAIVDALATASGGALSLADAPGGGLEVRVALPVASGRSVPDGG